MDTVTSHNKSSKRLWRDVTVVAVITLFVLILSAFLANTCHQILLYKYAYIPSSFENMNIYSFLRPKGAPLPQHYATPLRAMGHDSLFAGIRIHRPGTVRESGYQVVRLATELMPATLAMLGADFFSPFWAVLFYFILILFGIAQQLAIWHCVITGVLAINAKALKSWETTITFFTCAAGFVLGLPMTTELGVYVVYFLDHCMGGGWWVLIVTLAELCAVLMVRGRPYTGEHISTSLFGKGVTCAAYWAVPILTFVWNVVMPVALLVVCITIFKTGGYKDMWVRRGGGYGSYWPPWSREVGVLLQLVPLLCIPVVALIQSYRYLSNGPPDILDRLSNLYRPMSGQPSRPGSTTTGTNVAENSETTNDVPPAEDPPPKYTPPPSYSTATGARIAKMLRQSFRRSVRRIQSALESDPAPPRPPPPDYSSVLVEINNDPTDAPSTFTAAEVAQVLRCSFRRNNPPLPSVHGSWQQSSSMSAPTSWTDHSDRQDQAATSAPNSLRPTLPSSDSLLDQPALSTSTTTSSLRSQ